AVRSAARFVFRDRPDIVREATSAYERRRRAAARRAEGAKKAPQEGGGGPAGGAPAAPPKKLRGPPPTPPPPPPPPRPHPGGMTHGDMISLARVVTLIPHQPYKEVPHAPIAGLRPRAHRCRRRPRSRADRPRRPLSRRRNRRRPSNRRPQGIAGRPRVRRRAG